MTTLAEKMAEAFNEKTVMVGSVPSINVHATRALIAALDVYFEERENPIRESGDISCPKCKAADFADPETQAFVCVISGYNNTPGEGAVHWYEGWIVCRECGHTEWTGDSS